MQLQTLLMRTATSKPLSGVLLCIDFSCYIYSVVPFIDTFVSVLRIEGGIPPLVELLKFIDTKVQRAAAGALRTLAFKNDGNKNQVSDFFLFHNLFEGITIVSDRNYKFADCGMQCFTYACSNAPI